jgi:phage gp36-like protein
MSWIQLQNSDVLNVISYQELQIVRTLTIQSGQADPDLVRGFLSNQNPLGPEGTIPDKLVAPTLDIFAFYFFKRTPTLLNDDRRSAYKEAIALLELIRKGDLRVEAPLTAATEQPQIAIPNINTTPPRLPTNPCGRQFTRVTEDGI